MIPETIQIKYQQFDNPYRKLFSNKTEYVGCDFSDLVPSYKMDLSKDCPSTLINSAIIFAEEKEYYSFYTMVPREKFEEHIVKVLESNNNYILIVEEEVESNEKPINLLFWEWLFETVNQQDETLILHWILPNKYRKNFKNGKTYD